jgi:N6-L-threonylcarbamoyladenine synthase
LNQVLREKLTGLARKKGVRLLLSPPELCTDNAAMIAGAAYERVQQNRAFEPDDVAPGLRLETRSHLKEVEE